VVIIYLAYLLVTVPALRARLDRRMPRLEGGFSLGRWGLPVNLFAVGYGAAMMVNITWPRREVYDPAGTSWMLQDLALLSVVALVVVGLVVHRLLRGRLAPALYPRSAPSWRHDLCCRAGRVGGWRCAALDHCWGVAWTGSGRRAGGHGRRG
jgi:hypothetical protein